MSVDKAFTLRIAGTERQAISAYVPAYEPHQVISDDRFGAQLVIEPETFNDPVFPDGLLTISQQRRVAEQILAGFSDGAEQLEDCAAFDRLFFGRELASRKLDARVRDVAGQISASPSEKHSADYHSQAIGLSVSRFSHLFRAEAGTTFRRYCAWKRARGVMPLAKNVESLVETALSAGYADSTHFCHSIRHFFGIRPRDLVEIMAPEDFRVALAGLAAGNAYPS
ncbi:AraC family transcriptional regulator [Sphingosinicella sp. LY1275]|uniref:AraC family transcriptional regulator n=1 Tax=Sphingosinicella sp. LY1275 TaxID=3095379 RepID=UPI002ADEB67D|nr:AraC family transcriptional regulator [Sphingosinicella sp. LY1275]MEA1015251.1 AraC family transcriptional regulator [Sphingosinicella sp. LY1275]